MKETSRKRPRRTRNGVAKAVLTDALYRDMIRNPHKRIPFLLVQV